MRRLTVFLLMLSVVVFPVLALADWEDTLQANFDYADTFDGTTDWSSTFVGYAADTALISSAASACATQRDSSDFPLGGGIDWSFYTTAVGSTGNSSDPWVGTKSGSWSGVKCATIDYQNPSGDMLRHGPSRLAFKIGDSPDDGYASEVYMFFMIKFPDRRFFQWTDTTHNRYHNFLKMIDIGSGFTSVARWGTDAEYNWLKDAENCTQPAPCQYTQEYGNNAGVWNFDSMSASGYSESINVTRLSMCAANPNGEYCGYTGCHTDPSHPTPEAAMSEMIYAQEWFGVEVYQKMSNPHGTANGTVKFWVYDSDGNVLTSAILDNVETFADGSTAFNHGWNKFTIGGNRAGPGYYTLKKGTHNGSNGVTTLSDSTAAFPDSYAITNIEWYVYNTTAGKELQFGKISSVTATTITATRHDGGAFSWDAGDTYEVHGNIGFGPIDYFHVDDVIVNDTQIGPSYFTLLNSSPTCSDGLQNGDETGMDCGGSCDPCVSDTTAPTVTEVTPVSTPSTDTTPQVVIRSNEAGTLSCTGGCSCSGAISADTNTTVNLGTLSAGTYTCGVAVTDAASNLGSVTLTQFVITENSEEVHLMSYGSKLFMITNP